MSIIANSIFYLIISKNLSSLYSGMYTIEFQKRGLPHAHILLWLDGENRLHNGSNIDKIISAELPNPDL